MKSHQFLSLSETMNFVEAAPLIAKKMSDLTMNPLEELSQNVFLVGRNVGIKVTLEIRGWSFFFAKICHFWSGGQGDGGPFFVNILAFFIRYIISRGKILAWEMGGQ